MSRTDELRLVIRVARMYYEWGLRQNEIAAQLGLSQSTVSRLLNRSKAEGLIRIEIASVPGVYAETEEQLIKKFGLRDVIVVETLHDSDERLIHRDLVRRRPITWKPPSARTRSSASRRGAQRCSAW